MQFDILNVGDSMLSRKYQLLSVASILIFLLVVVFQNCSSHPALKIYGGDFTSLKLSEVDPEPTKEVNIISFKFYQPNAPKNELEHDDPRIQIPLSSSNPYLVAVQNYSEALIPFSGTCDHEGLVTFSVVENAGIPLGVESKVLGSGFDVMKNSLLTIDSAEGGVSEDTVNGVQSIQCLKNGAQIEFRGVFNFNYNLELKSFVTIAPKLTTIIDGKVMASLSEKSLPGFVSVIRFDHGHKTYSRTKAPVLKFTEVSRSVTGYQLSIYEYNINTQQKNSSAKFSGVVLNPSCNNGECKQEVVPDVIGDFALGSFFSVDKAFYYYQSCLQVFSNYPEKTVQGVVVPSQSKSRLICGVDSSVTPVASYWVYDKSCPENYILVKYEIDTHGVQAKNSMGQDVNKFCVSKFEARNTNGFPFTAMNHLGDQYYLENSSSQLSGVNSRANAKAACEMEPGTHLIKNSEWMTIANQIEKTASNWKDGVLPGTVGSSSDNQLNIGNDSLGIFKADGIFEALKVSKTDSEGCTGMSVPKDCGGTWNKNKRTHKILNGEVIWDFSGNLAEYVDEIYDLHDYTMGAGGWWNSKINHTFIPGAVDADYSIPQDYNFDLNKYNVMNNLNYTKPPYNLNNVGSFMGSIYLTADNQNRGAGSTGPGTYYRGGSAKIAAGIYGIASPRQYGSDSINPPAAQGIGFRCVKAVSE